jgi:hypothetical protein
MAMLNNQRVYVQVTIQCTRIDGLSTSPDGEHVFVLFGWQVIYLTVSSHRIVPQKNG